MIKEISKSIGEYKIPSVLTPVFVSLEVIIEVLIPIIMVKLIDEGVDAGNMEVITKTGGILLVMCIFSLIFGILSGISAAKASTGFAANLRRDMFRNVQTFSFANIDKFSTSGIVTRLTTDITTVQNAYQMIIRVAVRSPIMLICSLIAAFSLNRKLALVFLFAIPILGIGLLFIMKNAHPIFEKLFKTYDRLNLVVQENLRGIRVVKSFVREEYEKEKFEKVSDEIYKNAVSAEKLVMLNTPLMQFVMYSCTLLISYFGARFILSDSLTTGELMSMFSYSTQILMSLMMLSMIFVMITMSRASAERICEILKEKTDISNADDTVKEVKNGDIEFEDVEFSYSKEKDAAIVLDKINLNIKSGQSIGIIGSTGSAKTSLVQLIPRLFDVNSGIVRVGGIDVRQYDMDILRNSVSMVLQKNELFSGTIKENLRWGNENATDEEVIKAAKLSQAHDFIMGFENGYDTFIEQGGSNVSGGQKQRLCIARALLKKPKILILDDSTSAVDTKTDALIRRAFEEEIPDTTKIIIAQRIASVEHCDNIIILDSGKVAAQGNHNYLMANSDIYKELYTSQKKGGDDK